MVYVKWTLVSLIAAIVGAFLHYTLPQHDIVRITYTEVRRVDVGANALFWASSAPGNAEGGQNRDIRFIEAFRPDGRPMIYRNEDTGWGWPPYLKMNTSNVQAEANDLISSKEAPQWVVVRHYGWRAEFMSIYPNAVSLRPVAGPDVRIVPWFNIILLAALGLGAIWAWRSLARLVRGFANRY